MSIKTGDNPGSRRVGGVEEDSKRQRLGSQELPQLFTHLERLPLEMLEEVAKHFKEREDLKSFSKISYLTKGAALREINLQNKSLAITELQVLSDVNPPKPENPLSVIDFFQDILADRRDPNFANLFPGAQIDVDKLQELQQKLIALATAQVAEKFTKLELECNRGIANGDVSIESIDEKYASLKGALVCEALEFVISSSVDPEAGRGDVVRKAAENGHLAVIQALLSTGQISEEKRGQAVGYAAYKGHLPVVRFLLNSGFSISEYSRRHAVIKAATKGHLAVVELLLSSGRISKAGRGWAVKMAAFNNRLAVVELLLSDGRISKADRDSAITMASKSGYHAVADFLKQNQGWSCSLM